MRKNDIPEIICEKTYTIGEAADVLGVSIPTLRLYEREGLIIPARRESKHRRYAESDLNRIRCMRRMINEEKISIAGIRRMLSFIPCWNVKGCPSEIRQTCAAFNQHDGPCWTMSQKPWNCRSADCRLCPVYTEIANCTSLKQTITSFTTSVEPLPPTHL
jgi:MerR family transcriptional regulator, heat shock protein HspR